MITEGLVTTTGDDNGPHVAPMGPELDLDAGTLILKPFTSSQTYKNLKRHPEGVFHLVDDVELLARAAIGQVGAPTHVWVPTKPATRVRGFVLEECCRAIEFRVEALDDAAERAVARCSILAVTRLGEFRGFNRARHAVLEAAILATRAAFLPIERMRSELEQLEVAVRKTGGPRESASFALLRAHVEAVARDRSATSGGASLPAAVRVRTGSRLHFGLLSPTGSAPRKFGSVGCMVDEPGIVLDAKLAAEPHAEGPLAARVENTLRSISGAASGGSACASGIML